MFGGQAGVGSLAGNIISYAASQTPAIRIDAIMQAPYFDVSNDTTVVAACATTYSNYPGSAGYQAANPWTIGMYLDFVRWYCYFASQRFINSTVTALASYVPVVGQVTPPFAMNYEAAIQVIVPQLLSTTDPYMRGEVAEDCYFHPYLADVETALQLACQVAGCGLSVCFDVQNLRHSLGGASINGTDDGNGTTIWGYTTSDVMTWGLGDGSTDGNGNATVNITFNATGQGQDLANVSPKLQGWRNWASVANASGAVSVPWQALAKAVCMTEVVFYQYED